MTESDERAIYEWAKPRLRNYEWTYGYYQGQKTAVDSMEGWFLEDLPTLDMNFAFDVCLPKLEDKSVKVMYNNMGSREWWLDPAYLPINPICRFDFYDALLAYIKGVK